MSRIDEALERASAGVVDRADLRGISPVARPADESLLEQYPRETRRSVVREEPRAPQDRGVVDRAIPMRPPLAVTPRPAAQRVLAAPEFDPKLVLDATADHVPVEQYRRLAASVHELQLKDGLKTLTVTSAVPREGKTLTVSNLALTLSESYGRRVLLIDADLRRPSLHQLFGLRNAVGLIDVLRSERNDLPLTLVTPMLSVLPAGQPGPNPVAGITSERMRVLLAEAVAEFDWVLLDAPPVTIMPDAGLLAGLTGGIVLVIGAGSTPYPLVARAIDELGRDCIVGTVLNRIDANSIPATEYYHSAADSSAQESQPMHAAQTDVPGRSEGKR